MFCNLYAYDSEKRPLYVKQLTLLAPSFKPKWINNIFRVLFTDCVVNVKILWKS